MNMKKWIAIVSVSFLVLIIGTAIVLNVYEDDIRKKVEEEINSRIEAVVEFDKLDLSLWRHFPNVTLTLSELSIAGRDAFSGDTLLSAPQFHVELSTLSFFKGEIDLRSIQLVEPDILVRVLKNGNANYLIMKTDSTASASGEDSDFKVQIDELIIEKGSIVYQDALTQTNLFMVDFDHRGKGDFSKDVFDYETTTSVGELSVNYDGVPYLDKKNLSIDLAMGVDTQTLTFRVLKNTVRINHFTFGLQGYATLLPDAIEMDLKFASQETALKNILSLLPGLLMKDMEHITTNGEASFEGYARGRYALEHDTIPVVHIDLEVKDGTFKVDSLPAALNNIQFDLVIDNQYQRLDSMLFDLRSFHFEVGDQPVHGRVKLKGVDKFHVDADVLAKLNLHEIETIYPIPGIDMSGHVDLEMKANGNYVPATRTSKLKNVPQFSFDAKVSKGYLHYDSLPASVDDINMHLVASNTTGKLENTSIHVNHLNLRLDDNVLTGYAHIDGLSSSKIESELKANLDLTDLNRIFPLKGIDTKGELAVDMKMNGLYDSALKLFPVVDANLLLQHGFLKSSDYPESITDITFNAELINTSGKLKDGKLNIREFSYQLEGEPFSVTGSVTDFENYNFDMKVKGEVDLKKLTNVYAIPGLSVSGIINSDVEITGTVSELEKGTYGHLTSQGTVEITDLVITGDEVPSRILINDAFFRLTPQKILLKKLAGKFGKSNVEMTGELSNYMSFVTANNDLVKGDIILKCDTLFVNEWIPKAEGSGETSSGALEVFEIPKNVDFEFDSDIKHVTYDDIKITDLDGQIKLKDGVMTLHETGFNSLDAKFSVTGDYNTKDIAHPFFDFHLDVKELDIQRSYQEIKLVRTLAPATANCAGTFSISYDLNGELNNDFFPKTETLKGGGRIRIANAKIDGMKIFEELSKAAKKSEVKDPHLKDFVMDTEIRDNKIFVKPFAIKVSGFNTEVEGVNDISGAIQYLVKIELLPIEKIKIPFHVTGTYDNPKVALGKGATLPE